MGARLATAVADRRVSVDGGRLSFVITIKECDSMEDQNWPVEQFEANRTRLRAVAYRMLGSLSEADDAVQESWLRLSRSDAGGIVSLSSWLTTVVARVCLNTLCARQSRREEPLGARCLIQS